MGYDFADNVKHIGFGMLLQDGKKMSTRHGKSVILMDVLNEAIELAKKYILEKNPNIGNIDEVSKKIGVGAVVFNDLKNYRINDVEFNLEDTLKFEGNTGPYLQYTYARINSLLSNKSTIEYSISDYEIDENKWNLIWSMSKYEETIINAKINNDPSLIAKYLLDLASDFNKFYAHEKIVDENKEYTEFKLDLCAAVATVIKNGLSLLNIDVIKQM